VQNKKTNAFQPFYISNLEDPFYLPFYQEHRATEVHLKLNVKNKMIEMNTKFLVLGIVLFIIAGISVFQLANITGFFGLGGKPTVEVRIEDGEKTLVYKVEIGSRESALDTLVRVATVDYKTFGEMGAKITEINGKKEDEEHVWLFLVNGKVPYASCSHYYPNNDDVITFKYVSIDEAAKYI